MEYVRGITLSKQEAEKSRLKMARTRSRDRPWAEPVEVADDGATPSTSDKTTKAEKKARELNISRSHKGSTFYIDLDQKKKTKGKRGKKKSSRTIAQALARAKDSDAIPLKMNKGDALIMFQPTLQSEGDDETYYSRFLDDIMMTCSAEDDTVLPEDVDAEDGVKFVAVSEGSTVVDVFIDIFEFSGSEVERDSDDENDEESGSLIQEEREELGLPIQFAISVEVTDEMSRRGAKQHFLWDGMSFEVISRPYEKEYPTFSGTRMLGFVNGRQDFELVNALRFDEDDRLQLVES